MIREHRYEWDILYIKCPKCWERKPIDAFSKSSKRTFWIQSKCKECHRKYHIANKEKIRDRARKYYWDNRDDVLDKHKKYWAENKETRQKYNKNYYITNRDDIIKNSIEYYHKNKEAILANVEKYRKNNKEELNKKQKEYYIKNKKSILLKGKEKKQNHSEELWFNRHSFHIRAIDFVDRNSLRPNVCPICWEWWNIEMHHPSYETYDKRSEIVFCCKSCHKKIHLWKIECPETINLLDYNPK